jgi:hypothetical protein
MSQLFGFNANETTFEVPKCTKVNPMCVDVTLWNYKATLKDGKPLPSSVKLNEQDLKVTVE